MRPDARCPHATPVAGCTLFFDVDLDAMVEYVCDCATQARSSFTGAFRLRQYVAGAIARFAPCGTTPAALHGNMEVSVTVLPTSASGNELRSTVNMSMLTRPTVRPRAPSTSTGVPVWQLRG